MEAPGTQPLRPIGLVHAAVYAVLAAVLARETGLPGAAGAIVAAAAWSSWRRATGPWLCAVPAALAAASPGEPTWVLPRAGPVHVSGTVLPGVRVDPTLGETRVRLRPDGGRDFGWCVIEGAPALLPGDHVAGAMTLPGSSSDSRPFVRADVHALTVTQGSWSWHRLTEGCRARLQASLLAAFDPSVAALMCHLVLGAGPPIPTELEAAHRATGLTHLLAVSGAHASMLAWLLAIVGSRATGRDLALSRVGRWLCAGLLLLYGAITGMEPPVFRALAAFYLLLFARSRGRRVSPASGLAAPALLTAVLAPDELFRASFNLSYAAVLGLAVAGVFHARSHYERYVRGPLVGSIWATLLTTPLTLAYFGQVAPWTIVATPVLAPCVATMLAGGLIVATTGGSWPIVAAITAVPVGWLAGLYGTLVEVCALLPGAPIHSLHQPSPACTIGIGLVGLGWTLAHPTRTRLALSCLALSVPHFAPITTPAASVTLAAVGHGQCCVVHSGTGRTIVVDCGSLGRSSRPPRVATAALAPRRRVDLLVLTHRHADHVSGAARLAESAHIESVAFPIEMRSHRVVDELVAAGTRPHGIAPGASETILPGVTLMRPRADSIEPNDRSLWAHVVLGTWSTLITGDPLDAGVAAWLTDFPEVRADVLVLPHHGRFNAHTEALIRAVTPELTLVSNRGSREETAQAWQARRLGVPVLETGEVGTIRLSGDHHPAIETERPMRLRGRASGAPQDG